MSVRRLYVEKRQGFDIPAQKLFADLKELFAIEGIEQVRVIRRYDIEGLTDAEYAQTKPVVFYEPPVDVIYEEELPEIANARVFAVEALKVNLTRLLIQLHSVYSSLHRKNVQLSAVQK